MTDDAPRDRAAVLDRQMTTPSEAEPWPEPLLQWDTTNEFRTRWEELQAAFVDDPRKAVERADALVAEVMERISEIFATQRAELEKQWSDGDATSTEDLRMAFQRYRAYIARLLSL